MNHSVPMPAPQQPPGTLMPGAVPPAFAPLQLGLSEESKLVLVEYWRSILKRKWAILGLAVVLAFLAGAIGYAMTPVYRSTAMVKVEQARGKLLSIEDLYTGGIQSREHYQTQVEILKSREVAVRTAKALKLWEHPDMDPRKPDESLTGKLKSLIGIEAAPKQWTEDTLADAVAGKVMRNTTVNPIRLSQLITVSFDSSDKQLAARVANALATNYIEADRESKFSNTREMNAWLESRATELKQRLANSEAALQKYREENNLVNLSGSAQALAGQQAKDVGEQLAQARSRRLQFESAYQQVSGITNADFSAVPAVLANAGVAAAQAKEAEAANALSTLLETLGSGHPKVQEAQVALREARAVLKARQQSVVASITQEYQTALRAERSLQGVLDAASNSVQAVNRKEAQLAILEREVSSNRELYSVFMNRAKETDVGGDIKVAVARIVDAAIPANLATSPKKGQMVGVALVLGLFLGAMGSLLLDRLDNTIKGGESAEMRLRQPVLTVLPQLEGDPNAQESAKLFMSEPSSHHAEAIRTARTGVMLSAVDEPNRILMVTSSVPGEGKTTLCANLSLALAQTKRTLLIDADMRRPQVGERLGLPKNAKGLSNLVTGTASLKECVHQVPDSHLLVMPAGDLPPNPLDLLVSQRFKDMIKHLQAQLDFIIIDSPPVELVSDAMALAPMAHGTIYVVKAMETPYPLARKGIGRLERAGAKMLGLVVNGLNFDHAQRYYGEQVIGGYYAAYGYGGKNPYGGPGPYGAAKGKKAANDRPEADAAAA